MTAVKKEPTAADRCDRCGARAYMIAEKAPGMILKWCVHHGKKTRPALERNGFEVLDYSILLKAEK